MRAIEFPVPSEGRWQERCLAFCLGVHHELVRRPELVTHQWSLTPLVLHSSRVLIDLLATSGLPSGVLLMASQTLLWQTVGFAHHATSFGANRLHAGTVEELGPLVGAFSDGPLAESDWREFAEAFSRGEYESMAEFALRNSIRGLETMKEGE
jgi:hypothetical protein